MPSLASYPWADIKSNPNIVAAITPRGAHGHFVTGWNFERWHRRPMADFLNAVDVWDKETLQKAIIAQGL